MAILHQDDLARRTDARDELLKIAQNIKIDPEHRTAAAAVLLQDIAIEENS